MLGRVCLHSIPFVLSLFHSRVSDGELLERIIADNDLTEAVAVRYLSQLLSGVECLHFISVAHLDIKVGS